MTVVSEQKKNQYNCDGSQTVFPYTFLILSDTHLLVVHRDEDGNETVLSLGTDYSVSDVGNPSGGNVTTVATYPVLTTLTITRNVPATQETDYIENDIFPADSHEKALDKLTMIVQEVIEKIGRAILGSITDIDPDLELPNSTIRAGKLLSFNEDGDVDLTDFVPAEKHASSHEVGGEDLVDHDSLPGFVEAEHLSLPNTIAEVLSSNDITRYIDIPMSPMVLTGAVISAGTNAGTIKVSAGTFLLRDVAGDTESLTYQTISQTDNIALTNPNVSYYVHADYNGGVPQYSIDVTPANGTTVINLGRALREADNTIHFTNGGYRFSKGIYKSHHRASKLRQWEFSSEIVISDNGDKTFAITAGEFFHGLTATSFSAWDSAGVGGDRFTYVLYYGGTWHYLATQQYIDVDNYNDVDDAVDGLATCNRYKCDWVFVHPDDGHVYVVYGQDNKTLGKIEESTPPVGIPDLVDVFGCLIGRIIVNGGVAVFQRIEMANAQVFIPSPVIDHNDLSNIGTDDHHAQLHAASHNLAGEDELNHDNLAGFVEAEHLSLPNTIASVLSDHNKAAHDALGLDHGSLSGKEDDDHTQYHNNTRGDARYFQKTEFLNVSAGAGDAAMSMPR